MNTAETIKDMYTMHLTQGGESYDTDGMIEEAAEHNKLLLQKRFPKTDIHVFTFSDGSILTIKLKNELVSVSRVGFRLLEEGPKK